MFGDLQEPGLCCTLPLQPGRVYWWAPPAQPSDLQPAHSFDRPEALKWGLTAWQLEQLIWSPRHCCVNMYLGHF